MDTSTKNQERVYKYEEVCFFRKTKERFGGLSNMASGFPVKVNGILILSSEALYQACRFPHLPDVQKKIISEKSPMTAKMVSKPFRDQTRQDWDNIRVDVMYWCLRVKLAQNFITFGQLLESTFDKPIVEESNKDPFWGATKSKNDESLLKGINALGRLLMKLRQEYNSSKRYNLLFVESLNIPNFSLYGEQIRIIDERQTFIDYLQKHWGLISNRHIENVYKGETIHNSIDVSKNLNIVSESITEVTKPKKTVSKKRQKPPTSVQPKLL